jgi:AcrR family transcriptional regulator
MRDQDEAADPSQYHQESMKPAKRKGGSERPARARPRPRAARSRQPYHHGDLRAALLAAAEEELAENGVDGFKLRGCARRAGVSHAAPAHHFRDVKAILTELAAIGFERLSASMARHADGLTPGRPGYLLAIGRGYVAFALAWPQYFQLIFRVGQIEVADPRYAAAGAEAFAWPVKGVGALYGSSDPMSNPQLAARVIRIWSLVHGFSELLLAGQFDNADRGSREAFAEVMLPMIVGTDADRPGTRALAVEKEVRRAASPRHRGQAR